MRCGVMDTGLTRVAEHMVCPPIPVLDYETPPPRRTAGDAAQEFVAWCQDSATGLTFLLGAVAMAAGGAAGSPRVAGVLLMASIVLTTAATVRWAYGRPARW